MDRQFDPVQMKSIQPITQGLQHIPTEPPAWAETAGRVIHYLMNDFGGGPRWLKLAWVINFQKLATIPLFGVFIAWYHNTSAAAWIYLAMHGTYGVVWVIKDLAFPDPNFHKRIRSTRNLPQDFAKSFSGRCHVTFRGAGDAHKLYLRRTC